MQPGSIHHDDVPGFQIRAEIVAQKRDEGVPVELGIDDLPGSDSVERDRADDREVLSPLRGVE
jgi:hypothetical protein